MKTTRYLAFFAVVLLVACGPYPSHVYREYRRELSALTMKTGVSGSFFLASGSFGADPIYVFVETDDNGMSAVKSISVKNGAYIEDITDEATPYVEYYTCKFDGGGTAGVNCLDARGVPKVLSNTYISSYYLFHIPRGTLATSYDLGFAPPQP